MKAKKIDGMPKWSERWRNQRFAPLKTLLVGIVIGAICGVFYVQVWIGAKWCFTALIGLIKYLASLI